MSNYLRTVTQQAYRPPVSALAWLDIELTERCNFRCQHCYICRPADEKITREQEISLAFVQDILAQAAALGALSVRFTGGEPLLRPDFVEIYLSARRLGLSVVLFTNASLLTPEIADLLAAVPPRNPIEVSIYGMSPTSYQAVTQVNNAYCAAQRGVDLLLARNIPFVVKSALLPEIKEELPEFFAWAKTISTMKYSPNISMNFDLRCRRDDEEANARIRALRATPHESVAAHARDRSVYLREMKRFFADFSRASDDRLFNCGDGHSGAVDAYGNLQFCLSLRAPELTADLRTVPLRDALQQVTAIRTLHATNAEYLARCARCFLKSLCEQCPAKSWMEHGTLDTPVEYFCDVAHAQAVDLGLLAAKERAWEVRDWRERIERFVANDERRPLPVLT